jgi:flagellar M-ring protein FliF
MTALLAQLRALGPSRLALLGGAGLAVLGLLAWLVLRASQPPMALLYADLDTRDAGQVVAALERARVPHRLEAGGSRILAPEDQIARLRLTLAREGLPQGGSVGYEIFDRGESLTTTPFQQDVNRLRALEGEIARSIRQLAGVRAARVHLVLPRREAFTRERADAQASVVLTMQGAQRLDREGVQAVLHLVATAVPGLRPQNVSIVDSRGALLARGGQALAGPGAAQSQEEIRRGQELRIARAVEEMLERTLGPGRVRAEATVEMDFDRVQTTEERFDPDNQVPRSQQSVQESSRNAEGGGAATVQNNVPGGDPAGGGNGGSQESRQEETTNFEIGRTTRNTLREHPVVRRQSVAVLVDGVWEPGANGAAATFRERTAEEVARIASLVRGAIGFDERRGDTVEVVSLRFAEPPAAAPEPGGMFDLAFSSTTIARLLESALFALVALVAILLVGRPAVGRLVTLANRPAATGPGAAPALAGAAGAVVGAAALSGQGEAVAALPGAAEGDAMVSIAMVEGQMRASSITRMQDLVDRHPEEALSVVRRWMTPEGA